MRVLITGGAGFIGSHTAEALLKWGHEVVLMDNLSEPVHHAGQPFCVPAGARLEIADVRDRSAWFRLAPEADVIFHFAARQDYLLDFSAFFDVNVTGTALMYEVIVEQRLPVSKVIIASSQAVYGEGRYLRPDGSTFIPEMRTREQLDLGQWDIQDPTGRVRPTNTPEAAVNPKTQYALSKWFEESAALSLGKRFGIPTTCLRYSIVQGPGQSFWNAYSGACRLFSLAYHFGGCPVIYEDGLQTRDFVNIEDVVRANLLVMDHTETTGEVFNVGGGRAYTVRDLAEMAARVYDQEFEPSIPGEYRFGDTRHICSDTTKLAHIGWRPEKNPEYSLRCYRDWLTGLEASSDALLAAYRKMKETGVVVRVKGQ